MWKLSGFADEISPDLAQQLALLNQLGIESLEFRSAWGTKVLDLTDAQLAEAKKMMDAAGVDVSSIGSDLGKIGITDPFEAHLERAAHAIEVANLLGAPYIRVFSFFIPEGADADGFRDEVLRRTRAMVDLAEAGGVTLLHENEKDIFGDIPRRVADLLATIDSPSYRGVFDPANYVQCGTRPFDEAYPLVRPYIDYLHIKDALVGVLDDAGLEKVVPAGQGDGQVRELLAAFAASGFDGYLSLEPHLGDVNAFGGQSGPELWATAADALVSILDELELPWQ